MSSDCVLMGDASEENEGPHESEGVFGAWLPPCTGWSSRRECELLMFVTAGPSTAENTSCFDAALTFYIPIRVPIEEQDLFSRLEHGFCQLHQSQQAHSALHARKYYDSQRQVMPRSLDCL